MKKLNYKTISILILLTCCLISFGTIFYLIIAGVQFTHSAFRKKVEQIESLPSTAMFPSNVDCFYFTDSSCMCISRYSIIVEDDTFVNSKLSDHVQTGDSIIKESYNGFLKIVKSK